MSKFLRFMKPNKTTKANEFYAPTASLCDENGKPLEWEFKHITSKQNEQMRENCTVDVPITGKPNMYRPKLNTSKYLTQIVVTSTVCPDLYDAKLSVIQAPPMMIFA